MTSDLDIYRSTHELINQYGDDASTHAAMRADAFLEKGGMGGRTVWLRIMKAVE